MLATLKDKRFAALPIALVGILLTAAQCGASFDSPPVLSSIADQRTPTGDPVDIPFSVSDENPSSVTVDGASDDSSLVAAAGIEVLGSGADRTLRITPAPSETGRVIITLRARDDGGQVGTQTFGLDVTEPFQTVAEKLTASEGADDDFFGRSVAIDGDNAIVGAFETDLAGANEGSAHVYRREGDTWVEIAALTADDAADDDNFGWSVAIDGDFAIVGAYADDLNGSDEGSAYVFQRSGDSWTQVDKLTANDAADDDLFGWSVAIDGDHAIIGARRDDLNGTDEGSAYVFQRSGGAWVQTDKLTAGDAADNDQFGFSVAIDGEYAIIAAFEDDLSGTDEGSAYLYRRSGDVWVQSDKVTAGDAADFDNFGSSVAIDGEYAIVGAPRDDLGTTDEGSAYVFRRIGDEWVQIDKLAAGDAAEGDRFGFSVATDGTYAIVGARFDDLIGTNEGSAYVFRRSVDVWLQIDKLTAGAADPGADNFGVSVATDGVHAIVGAFLDDLTGTNEGSAYVFRK